MTPWKPPPHMIKFLEVTCECGEIFDSLIDFEDHQETLNKKPPLVNPGPEYLGEEAA